MDEAFARLTERQKQCLRLAARPMTSKEIAAELDLSYRTVENHLARAVQILGADGRFAAARMLVSHENAGEYKLRGYAETLVPADETGLVAAIGCDTGQWSGNERGDMAREHGAPFDFMVSPWPGSRRPFLIPTSDEDYQALDTPQRLILIVAIGVASLLAFGAIPAGFAALARLI